MIWRALEQSGAPLDRLSVRDFETPDAFIQFGVAPSRIDVFTDIEGVAFDDAYPARVVVRMDGIEIPALGHAHLILRASGRPQDRADVARLEEQNREKPETGP